ncbi:MAG: FG-GAP repeat protein [Myxococcales bacterium]|nr:FG-GAP repeat protein [Myxococcales bacterium]
MTHGSRPSRWLTLAALLLCAGHAFASPGTTGPCDFDGDAYHDLAVGSPSEAIGSRAGAGAINVMYGGTAVQNGHPTGVSSVSDAVFHQNSTNIEGTAETGDAFGADLACGDFNNDGWDDLAIGVPHEDVDGVSDAGAVQILYGSASGLSATASVADQLWHQDLIGLDPGESGDRFGNAVAVGHFDDDDYADLAIGVRGEDVALKNEGAIVILYGSSTGLQVQRAQQFHQGSPDILSDPRKEDQFGEVLAAADFDADGLTDLAVGSPYDNPENDDDLGNEGSVVVLYGTSEGLSADYPVALRTFFSPDRVGGTSVKHGQFGAAMAAGDFDDDGYPDLAIGAPGAPVGGQSLAGEVHVLRGGSDGLSGTGNQVWTQDSANILGAAENGDRFGHGLAAGDFDGDGDADLAIGVPGEDIGSILGAGLVNVLMGSTSGGLSHVDNTYWYQGYYGLSDTAEEGDAFGRTLSASDFNNDGFVDIAVGVPGQTVGSDAAAGGIQILMSSGSGSNGLGDTLWTQDSSGIAGAAEPGDRMGGELVSTGLYRVPYADGTDVRATNPHYGHSTRMDIDGTGGAPYDIVAAADGIVRVAVDEHFELPEGEPNNTSNNAVWIEHDNGEWTKYSHVRHESIPSGIVPGAEITAGTVIGVEGDVGQASGEHLHFHVLVPDDPDASHSSGNYLIPRFCVPGGVFIRSKVYEAEACPW